jgi:hypothetical protein
MKQKTFYKLTAGLFTLLFLSTVFIGPHFVLAATPPVATGIAVEPTVEPEVQPKAQIVNGQAFGGLIPCGKSGDMNQDPAAQPCTACHAILGGKNFLDYLTSIMVVVAVAVTFAMGIFYILSGVNVDLKKQAKEGLKAVLIGLVFMLSSWLIVSTVLFYLASDGFVKGDGNFFGLMKGEGVLGLTCSTYSAGARGQLDKSGTIYGLRSGSDGGGTSPGNGTCTVLADPNPCSVSNLQNTCFGSQAGRISQLCNVESTGGDPSSRSGSDICGNKGDRSFSGGLFQINIFAHGERLGADCANLGSKGDCAPGKRRSDGVCTSWNCTITDLAKFDTCMDKTLTAEGNIQIACAISNNGENLTPWACTANTCGLGGVSSSDPDVQNMCK